MSIRESLDSILNNYLHAKTENFKNHSIQSVFEKLKNELFFHVQDKDRYLAKESRGKGRWVDVPWFSVLDQNITDTTQNGYYVVYLLRSDCKGIYLTLGQGITAVEEKYKVNSEKVLSTQSEHYRSLLNISDDRLSDEPIDLNPQTKLSKSYGPGIVYSIYYSADNIPSEEVLVSDFKYMMEIYLNLYEINTFAAASPLNMAESDSSEFYEEDNTKVKAHISYERDRGVSKKVKDLQGYKCRCCNVDFEEKYGEVGRSCIDAHHLIPVSEAKGEKVKRDLRNDFAVLCAVCHRLIHRLEDTSDIENLKKVFFKK